MVTTRFANETMDRNFVSFVVVVVVVQKMRFRRGEGTFRRDRVIIKCPVDDESMFGLRPRKGRGHFICFSHTNAHKSSLPPSL